MRRNAHAWALLGVLALPLAAASEPVPPQTAPGLPIGAPNGKPLSGRGLDSRTQEVGALLRCPVCQGLSVADSPTKMALNMKAQVREMLAAGYEGDQVLAYFERSYGEFVRLEPAMRGVNWLVWLGPLFGLLAGSTVVLWALRLSRRRAATTEEIPADLPARDSLPDDPRLAAAVRRVRELAYGWPEGDPPAAGGRAS